MNRIRTLMAVAAAALLSNAPGLARAQTFPPIDISTHNPGWQASYPGGSGPAFQNPCVPVSCISISSTARADGQFVGGGTAEAFKGVWQAWLDFDVPATGPDGARLDLTIHGVDDRAKVLLNGKPLLVYYFLIGGEASISVVGGQVIPGQTNRLEITVTNNGAKPDGRPVGFQHPGDATGINLSGTISAVN
jgi:hypothetical protein